MTRAVVILALAAACRAAEPSPQESAPAVPDVRDVARAGWGWVGRFHDDSAGAVCWVVYGSSRAAISCLPDSALRGVQ